MQLVGLQVLATLGTDHPRAMVAIYLPLIIISAGCAALLMDNLTVVQDGAVAQYVAFLRGINLGSTNKISMPELRAMATDLGYTDVATYINSGNLIFSSTKKAAALEREISAAIKQRFGTNTDVAVRTPAQLRKILDANPYPDGSPSQVTVAFLTNAAPAQAKQRVAEMATDAEPFTFAGSEVYVHYSNGLGRSKLAEKFSAIIGVSSTVRNLRTVTKVLELSQDS